MRRRSLSVPGFLLASLLTAAVALAASSAWQKEDPAQWTSEDVYQILNNSPWSKSSAITVARGSGYGNNSQYPGGGNNGTWGDGAGPGMGRMGGGGMGGGYPGGGGMGYPGSGGGMGRQRGGYPSQEQVPNVTVQWVSALPVRLAQAKLNNASSAAESAPKTAPENEYVIAVLGFPKSGFGSQSLGANNPDGEIDDTGLASHLKVITVLSFAHERLNPTRVELNQGRDGRAIFYFEKSEPITPKDKTAEFRITGDRMELRQRFNLKDMQFAGKLEL